MHPVPLRETYLYTGQGPARAARGSQFGLDISQFLQGCVPVRYPSRQGYQPVVGQRLGNGARPLVV
jgi:hypothetical protein